MELVRIQKSHRSSLFNYFKDANPLIQFTYRKESDFSLSIKVEPQKRNDFIELVTDFGLLEYLNRLIWLNKIFLSKNDTPFQKYIGDLYPKIEEADKKLKQFPSGRNELDSNIRRQFVKNIDADDKFKEIKKETADLVKHFAIILYDDEIDFVRYRIKKISLDIFNDYDSPFHPNQQKKDNTMVDIEHDPNLMARIEDVIRQYVKERIVDPGKTLCNYNKIAGGGKKMLLYSFYIDRVAFQLDQFFSQSMFSDKNFYKSERKKYNLIGRLLLLYGMLEEKYQYDSEALRRMVQKRIERSIERRS